MKSPPGADFHTRTVQHSKTLWLTLMSHVYLRASELFPKGEYITLTTKKSELQRTTGIHFYFQKVKRSDIYKEHL